MGLISMDDMFGTNNVKYHLLMAFHFHYTWVLVAWVIMSQQTCEDLVEWLSAIRAKLLLYMPNWRPCFIVDDVPKEL